MLLATVKVPRLGCVFGERYTVALVLQDFAQKFPHADFIVNDQNVSHVQRV
jgi:hypothetical protein